MDTEQLMDQAEQIMATYAGRDLHGEIRAEMDRMVHQFFEAHVRSLDPSEVMDQVATPMKAMGWFNAYLCSAYHRRCCSETVPDDANTCRLS